MLLLASCKQKEYKYKVTSDNFTYIKRYNHGTVILTDSIAYISKDSVVIMNSDGSGWILYHATVNKR